MSLPLSVIDFATVRPGGTVAEAFADSVRLARTAETAGYSRIWYSEHHNMSSIASAAPAVLIAHVAAHTEQIRLGSGGVMLPNHSPLVVAEQFGTLAELHPGRIDLGLGRAPGTDPPAMRAMRRTAADADRFPQDVQELQAFLGDGTGPEGVVSVPGRGTHVPLYILGSSLFGAQLAAALGLPYAFASHFAPDALEEATAVYRARFQPSTQLAEPYVVAAVNVCAREDAEVAHRDFTFYGRARVQAFVSRGMGRPLTEDELDAVVDAPQGRQILAMIANAAVGEPTEVREYLEGFAERAHADELMVAPVGSSFDGVQDTLEVLGRAWGLDPVPSDQEEQWH